MLKHVSTENSLAARALPENLPNPDLDNLVLPHGLPENSVNADWPAEPGAQPQVSDEEISHLRRNLQTGVARILKDHAQAFDGQPEKDKALIAELRKVLGVPDDVPISISAPLTSRYHSDPTYASQPWERDGDFRIFVGTGPDALLLTGHLSSSPGEPLRVTTPGDNLANSGVLDAYRNRSGAEVFKRLSQPEPLSPDKCSSLDKSVQVAIGSLMTAFAAEFLRSRSDPTQGSVDYVIRQHACALLGLSEKASFEVSLTGDFQRSQDPNHAAQPYDGSGAFIIHVRDGESEVVIRGDVQFRSGEIPIIGRVVTNLSKPEVVRAYQGCLSPERFESFSTPSGLLSAQRLHLARLAGGSSQTSVNGRLVDLTPLILTDRRLGDTNLNLVFSLIEAYGRAGDFTNLDLLTPRSRAALALAVTRNLDERGVLPTRESVLKELAWINTAQSLHEGVPLLRATNTLLLVDAQKAKDQGHRFNYEVPDAPVGELEEFGRKGFLAALEHSVGPDGTLQVFRAVHSVKDRLAAMCHMNGAIAFMGIELGSENKFTQRTRAGLNHHVREILGLQETDEVKFELTSDWNAEKTGAVAEYKIFVNGELASTIGYTFIPGRDELKVTGVQLHGPYANYDGSVPALKVKEQVLHSIATHPGPLRFITDGHGSPTGICLDTRSLRDDGIPLASVVLSPAEVAEAIRQRAANGHDLSHDMFIFTGCFSEQFRLAVENRLVGLRDAPTLISFQEFAQLGSYNPNRTVQSNVFRHLLGEHERADGSDRLGREATMRHLMEFFESRGGQKPNIFRPRKGPDGKVSGFLQISVNDGAQTPALG